MAKKSEDEVEISSFTNERYVQVFRNSISSTLLEQLENSAVNLLQACKSKSDVKRGVSNVLHLGCWRKSSKEITITSDTKENLHAVTSFCKENSAIFNITSQLFKTNYPDLHDYYSKIQLPTRLFGSWASCAVNLVINNSGVKYHNDAHDFSNELCWVIPFENYYGANFLFPELAIAIETTPGDILCFRSKLLKHGTTDFIGYRRSLVLFTSNNVFISCEDK